MVALRFTIHKFRESLDMCLQDDGHMVLFVGGNCGGEALCLRPLYKAKPHRYRWWLLLVLLLLMLMLLLLLLWLLLLHEGFTGECRSHTQPDGVSVRRPLWRCIRCSIAAREEQGPREWQRRANQAGEPHLIPGIGLSLRDTELEALLDIDDRGDREAQDVGIIHPAAGLRDTPSLSTHMEQA